MAGQARHGAHFAHQRVDEARTHARTHFANGQHKAARRTLDLGVRGQAEVRLGHADGQVAEAVLLVGLDLRLSLGLEDHLTCAVDLARNRLDLLLDGQVERIEWVELAGFVAGLFHGTRQVDSACAAVRPVGGNGAAHAFLAANGKDRLGLAGVVCREGVDAHHGADAVLLHILNLLAQVGASLEDVVGVFAQHLLGQRLTRHNFVLARVQLERADGGDDHRSVGLESTVAALDVEELLCANVCTEARLGQQVVTALDANQVGQDAAVAVCDVGKRAGMHKCGRVLQRLEEVGLDCLLHKHRHRAGGQQLLGGDRLLFLVLADDDAPKAVAHIAQAGRQRQNRHHLARHRNVETGLARDAVALTAKANVDVAQVAVVGVNHAPPGNRIGVDVECVALVNMVVDHGREQVVGRGDGVEVAGHVQVELLHGHNLAVAAARRAALDAESRPLAGLAHSNGCLAPNVAESLPKPYGGGALALTQRRGGNRRDDDILGVGAILQFVNSLKLHLGHGLAIELDVTALKPHLLGNRLDGLQGCGLCDLYVAGYFFRHGLCSFAHTDFGLMAIHRENQKNNAKAHSVQSEEKERQARPERPWRRSLSFALPDDPCAFALRCCDCHFCCTGSWLGKPTAVRRMCSDARDAKYGHVGQVHARCTDGAAAVWSKRLSGQCTPRRDCAWLCAPRLSHFPSMGWRTATRKTPAPAGRQHASLRDGTRELDAT